MSILILVLTFIVIAAVLSFFFSAFGFLIGLVVRGLPLLLVIAVAVFFAQGGKVHIDWPASWRRR